MPFFNSFDSAQYPRIFQMGTANSALYTLHTDFTKPVNHPIYGNDLVAGTTGNYVYTVRTAVPADSRGFIPYWMPTIRVNATTARGSSLSITATHASATILYVFFLGRFNVQASPFASDPFARGVSTMDPASNGYWKVLARLNYTASSGGTSTVISFPSHAGQTPALATFGTYGSSDNLSHVYPTPMFTDTKAFLPVGGMASASSSNLIATNMDFGAIPTHGCSEIVAFPTFMSNTTGTVALVTPSMESGSATWENLSIATQFVS
jgi:hypothetical protein